MANYDRNFDYGLRGPRDTLRPRGGGYSQNSQEPRNSGGRTRRMTARYNMDYTRDPNTQPRPLNYAPYGGSLEVPVGGVAEYNMPYMTRGGTRTYRGGSQPMGWERGRGGYDRSFDAGRGYGRPWTGGYRPGYQGGSGGIEMRTRGGYDRDFGREGRGGRGYDRGYTAPSRGPSRPDSRIERRSRN